MVEFANRGFRSLGVAMAEGDGADGKTEWHMLGLLPLFDPPRHDTKDTILYCKEQGIEVKMVTGDHLLIGKETARMLGMGDMMFPSETLIKVGGGNRPFALWAMPHAQLGGQLWWMCNCQRTGELG